MATTTSGAGVPEGYDPSRFQAFAVTVDVVILTMSDSRLHVLLVRRGEAPFEGMLAIPGGFKRPAETLDEAAKRELREETGVDAASPLTQFGAYGYPERDPRMNVVTVGYLAVLRDVGAIVAGTDAADAALFPVSDVLNGKLELAFDHQRIARDPLVIEGQLELPVEHVGHREEGSVGGVRARDDRPNVAKHCEVPDRHDVHARVALGIAVRTELGEQARAIDAGLLDQLPLRCPVKRLSGTLEATRDRPHPLERRLTTAHEQHMQRALGHGQDDHVHRHRERREPGWVVGRLRILESCSGRHDSYVTRRFRACQPELADVRVRWSRPRSDCDDDLASHLAGLDVPDGLRGLAQGIGPVDNRGDLPGCRELAEDEQVGPCHACQEGL